MTTLTVLKRFEFESQLLRSGVLAVDSAGHSDEALIFIRGAPACIEQIVGKDQVPSDYRQVCFALPDCQQGPLVSLVQTVGLSICPGGMACLLEQQEWRFP